MFSQVSLRIELSRHFSSLLLIHYLPSSNLPLGLAFGRRDPKDSRFYLDIHHVSCRNFLRLLWALFLGIIYIWSRVLAFQNWDRNTSHPVPYVCLYRYKMEWHPLLWDTPDSFHLSFASRLGMVAWFLFFHHYWVDEILLVLFS